MKLYCYLGGVVLMTLVGIVIQCKIKPTEEDDGETSTKEPLAYVSAR